MGLPRGWQGSLPGGGMCGGIVIFALRAALIYPNSIPWASGSSVLQLIVFVWRRM
jgi:hypothetical protein